MDYRASTIVLSTTETAPNSPFGPMASQTTCSAAKSERGLGEFRIPMMVRFGSASVKPGACEISGIVALMDWMTDIRQYAAGLTDLKEQMKADFKSGTKDFKVHLDGYDLVPLLKGAIASGDRAMLSTTSIRAAISTPIRWNG